MGGSTAVDPATRVHSGRDRRLDVIRGFCIVSMTIGHLVPSSGLDIWTHPFVWVDGATGFVVCSGIVLGVTQSGGGRGTRPLLRRAAELHAIHVVLVVAAVAIRSGIGRPSLAPELNTVGGGVVPSGQRLRFGSSRTT